MPFFARLPVLCAATGLWVPVAAAAQTGAAPEREQQTSDSAAIAAADAFGERVGINQVGLYSPVQTRGFDLVAGGTFRLDGFYFHPAAVPSESLVAGSSVHVGIAAAALDLPSPTGVVGYRLRDPGTQSSLSLTAGFREEFSPSVEALGTLVSGDQRWAILGHALILPDANRFTGEDGPTIHLSGVGRWMPAPGTRVRLFGSYSESRSDGDLTVLATGDGVPPQLRPGLRYGPDWARSSSHGHNVGALLDHRADCWTVGASAIRSVNRATRSDVSVLEADSEGNVIRTILHTPNVETRSDSFEAKLARSFGLFGAGHRLGVAVRQRSTIAGRAAATAFPGGRFTMNAGPARVPPPDLPDDVARGRDRVDQRVLSATYALEVGESFDLRLGAHGNRYEKQVRDLEGLSSRTLDSSWLYSASAVWRPAPRWQLFASYVSGLEETGTAPPAAVNRGEVLPPVKARQYEVGARYEIAPNLGLIAAAFDILKPVYGLRTDGLYAPVGTVRHRGLEASLTGRLTSSTTVVLGANVVEPSVSGEGVETGLVRKVAAGVSRFNATVSVEQQLTPEWSVDAYFLHEGARRRDSTTAIEVRDVPWLILGTRYSRKIGRTQFTLRAQVVNAIDRRGYWATPSGPLVAIPPATYVLLLTAGI